MHAAAETRIASELANNRLERPVAEVHGVDLLEARFEEGGAELLEAALRAEATVIERARRIGRQPEASPEAVGRLLGWIPPWRHVVDDDDIPHPESTPEDRGHGVVDRHDAR